MIQLFDVNLLIALADPRHVHAEAAFRHFGNLRPSARLGDLPSVGEWLFAHLRRKELEDAWAGGAIPGVSARLSWELSRQRYSSRGSQGVSPIKYMSMFVPIGLCRTGLLTRKNQCAVKSHGSPVGETKQTHPGAIRSARNRLEG